MLYKLRIIFKREIIMFSKSCVALISFQLICISFVAIGLDPLYIDRLINNNDSIFDSFELKQTSQKAHHGNSASSGSISSSYSIGSVRFKFNDELLDLLERLNSTTKTQIDLRLINFTRPSQVPLFRTRLALFVNSSSNHSK